jgi:phosphatidylglycerophosphate synthase
MNPKALIPSGISAFRIVALPLFLYFNSVGSASLCLLVFASAICTDLLDGFIARKLNVTSKTGAYLMQSATCVFVAGIFLAFVLNGYYPVWLLLLIAGSFGQFAVTGYFAKRFMTLRKIRWQRPLHRHNPNPNMPNRLYLLDSPSRHNSVHPNILCYPHP